MCLYMLIILNHGTFVLPVVLVVQNHLPIVELIKRGTNGNPLEKVLREKVPRLLYGNKF